MTSYLLEHALLPSGVADDVLVTVEDGRWTAVAPAGDGPWTGQRIGGLTIPGLANCHSHAFHRALRGRTQTGLGSFWTWREQMYAVADRLDPDSYYRLARATYAEMVAAGITSVGEFHYLHHQPDGRPYDDPNAMGRALIQAARDAGIRIALLDTCYLASGIGKPPEGVQRRFSDGDADAWAGRVSDLDKLDHRGDVVVGAAIHSVRAVPRDQLGRIAEWSRQARPPGQGRPLGGPLHVHLSEQVAENEQCLAAYGLTPTQILEEAGALGDQTSVVHATHLTATDVETLGRAGTYACFCPTTERDLGDGIGPSRQLHDGGARLTLGSDSHAVIDPFEEMRAVELDERLATQARGHWSAGELMDAATTTGHASLGFADAGAIAVGHRADLVTLDLASPRTAGAGSTIEAAVFAAAAGDVRRVMVDGNVVFDGDVAQVGADLDRAIREIWR
ncbi:MAG: N-formimino-L-glutamate deiminase [Marmoricola sp.]|nr:N-formimino-L-glutamate deiminase [Marmoricola sp.]